MPRTKVIKKRPQGCGLSNEFREVLEANRRIIHHKIKHENEELLVKFKTELNKLRSSIPLSLANRTLGELMDNPPDWKGDISTEASVVSIMDGTRSRMEKTRRPLTRSSSLTDEGYLTAESSNTTSGSRKSRARQRTVSKPVRTSRSLSTRKQNKENSVLGKFKTPVSKALPNSYGVVTPKVAPHTPQVVLRRPKIGEMALSLQGSPLFTGSVVSEAVANVNIPLEDGRLFTIQPERGLRMSQIPMLDPEIKRQLETLRDNLNKVVSGKR